MYQLKAGIYFIRGALNGAILDTISGNVYSINEQARKILSGELPDESYWKILFEMGLAKNVEKRTKQTLPVLNQPATLLDFVWFEIVTDDCNERCTHCYADAMPKTYRTQQGASIPLVIANNRKRMAHRDWLKLIREVYALGCRKCQFIGGEPFLYQGPNKETVLDLAEYSLQMGYELVEIYTNATLLTPRKIKRIKELGISIAVSLYSLDPKVHNAITRTPGSHAKTMRALDLLKKYGIPTRVEVVLMQTNQHTIEETFEWRGSQGFGGKTPDPLRPGGRGDDPKLQPDMGLVVTYGVMTRPNFFVDQQTIAHYNSAHSCLLGKLTITEFGEVLPCIFSRAQVLGNVLEEANLSTIVAGTNVQKVWHTTKNDVMVCKDCEFRYACFDCRPLSEGASIGNASFLNAPYPRCSYNPYTGVWGEGLWTVSSIGQPVYDESCREVLQANIHRALNVVTTAETH
jgi:radical SAM protein with 4Fe4S-binding SPASM domain